MRVYSSYTPRNWEFGIGFYRATWYWSQFTDEKILQPSEIAFLLGPFSFCVEFGNHISVVSSIQRTDKCNH